MCCNQLLMYATKHLVVCTKTTTVFGYRDQVILFVYMASYSPDMRVTDRRNSQTLYVID